MKRNKTNTREPARTIDSAFGRTEVEGQNPKANDAPDQDVYHDDNRRNMYDPEVGKALKLGGKKSRSRR